MTRQPQAMDENLCEAGPPVSIPSAGAEGRQGGPTPLSASLFRPLRALVPPRFGDQVAADEVFVQVDSQPGPVGNFDPAFDRLDLLVRQFVPQR